MLAVLLVALGLLVACMVVGQAVLTLCGWEQWRPWSPAIGLAVLLILGGQIVWVPGRGTTVAVVVIVLALLALTRRGVRAALREGGVEAVLVGVGVVIVAGLPVWLTQASGVLGPGISDDMSAHLTVAWWLGTHDGSPPVAAPGKLMISIGYPVGPHGVAEALTRLTGAGENVTFTSLSIVVPALLALAALGVLGERPKVGRVLVAGVSGLAYLAAAYLGQGSFKETMEGLLLVTTVVALADLVRAGPGPARRAIPLGLLASASLYMYSLPGVTWLVGAALVLLALEVLRRRLRGLPGLARALVAPTAAAVVAGALATLPDLGRLVDFSSSKFVRESKKDWGNLHGRIPLREALGMWPSSEFRVASQHTRVADVLIALAAIAGAAGLAWWWRRRVLSVPAGVIAALVLWYQLDTTRGIYAAAKGLAILAPILMLCLGGPLLAAWERRVRAPRALALYAIPRLVGVILLLGAAGSSFAVLRDSRVGLGPQAGELDHLRRIVGSDRVLYLGVDDFAEWELRGTTLFTGRGLYSRPHFRIDVRPEKPRSRGSPFDVDHMAPKDLDRVNWVIAFRSAYGSAMPANFHAAARTPSFVLWRRRGPTPPRQPIEPSNAPGLVLNCANPTGRWALAAYRRAAVAPDPVVTPVAAWRGQPKAQGQSGHLRVDLPPGTWDVSLQYVVLSGLDLRTRGYHVSLPAYSGRAGPFLPAGVLHHRGGPLGFTARAKPYPGLGHLLHRHTPNWAVLAKDLLPLGHLAFTRHGGRERLVPVARACGKWVDYVVP